MAMRVIGDICQTVGKYVNRDGQEKGEYNKIGTLMQDDNGGAFCIKFIALPLVTQGKNGAVECWARVFSRDNSGERRQPAPRKEDTPPDRSGDYAPSGEGEDIPF